jgi:hypothetical protein
MEQKQLTEENFDALTAAVMQFLVRKIEDLLMKKKFTFVRRIFLFVYFDCVFG